MKISHTKLVLFHNHAMNYLRKVEQRDLKLKYAIEKKLKPQTEKIFKEYQETSEDINIEHCYVDERNVIVRDDKGDYTFTKEELRKRNKKQSELNERLVEVTPYIVEAPDNLTDAERNAFEGIVIKSQEELVIEKQDEPSLAKAE